MFTHFSVKHHGLWENYGQVSWSKKPSCKKKLAPAKRLSQKQTILFQPSIFRGKLAVFREGILIKKAKVQIQKETFETGYIWKVTIYYCIGDTPIFHKHHLYTIGDYG